MHGPMVYYNDPTIPLTTGKEKNSKAEQVKSKKYAQSK
jgi:hypothetical protein